MLDARFIQAIFELAVCSSATCKSAASPAESRCACQPAAWRRATRKADTQPPEQPAMVMRRRRQHQLCLPSSINFSCASEGRGQYGPSLSMDLDT